MKKQKIQTKISISVFILAILAMSSVFSIFAPNAIIWGNDEIDDTFNEEVLAISQGDDPWWDGDWQYRQCINVTNTGSYNLTDNWLSININYNTLVNDGKLKSDFGDIRIVENEEIRRYHIRKNFPSQNMLTIWFETNSTEGTSDFDTYLYYGNPSVSQASTYFANCPDGTTWWSFEEGESNPYTKTLPSGDWEVGLDSMQFCNVTFRDQGNDTATDGGPNYITSAPVGDYALEFDGNSNYMAINEELFFPNVRNLIDEVTVTCWYKVDNALDGNDEFSNWAFFDFDRSETFNFYLRGDTGQLEMSTSAYGGGGYSDFVSNTAGLNDNTWRFGACTYDGFDKKLYIDDGVLDATLDNAHDGDAVGGRGLGTGSTTRYGFLGEGSEADVFDEPEVVGIDGRNSYYYAGALDEVRYFNG